MKNLKKFISLLLVLSFIFQIPSVAADTPALSTDKTEYIVGEDIMVTATATGRAWVGLYPADETRGGAYIYYYYVNLNGNTSGTAVNIRTGTAGGSYPSLLDIPAGEYKLILYTGDDYTSAASTVNISVIEDPDAPVLSTNKTEYVEGEDIMVTAIGSGKDWVALYPADQELPSGAYIYYYYVAQGSNTSGSAVNILAGTAGPRTDLADVPAGDYMVVLLENDTYDTILETVYITVTEDTNSYTLSSASFDRTSETPGFAEGTLSVELAADSAIPVGYVAYWANDNGKLNGYSYAATFDYVDTITTYTFPANAMIPNGATRLLVYPESAAGIVEDASVAVAMTDMNASLGTPLAELQIVSDFHINAIVGAQANINTADALSDIKKLSPDSIGIFVNGDVIHGEGTATLRPDHDLNNDYDQLDSIIAAAGSDLPPIYYGIGNHEVMGAGTLEEKVALFFERTGNDTETPYFDEWVNGYHFIFITDEEYSDYARMSTEQLQWLETKLAENRDGSRPIFLFMHLGIQNTVAGTLSGHDWSGIRPDTPTLEGVTETYNELTRILKKYPEVVLSSGHTHWTLESEKNFRAYDDTLPTIINSAAVGYLWNDNSDETGRGIVGAQGWFVTVYEDMLVFRGRDFTNDYWVGSAQFILKLNEKVVNNKDVYVSEAGSDESGDGTASNPYLTISKAMTEIENDAEATEGTIYVTGTVSLTTATHTKMVTITANTQASTAVISTQEVALNGPTSFESITLNNSQSAGFYTGSGEVSFADVTMSGNANGKLWIGYEQADTASDLYKVTIDSIGTGATNNVMLRFNSRRPSEFNGTYDVTINGGYFWQAMFEGENKAYNGDVRITKNGGTIPSSAGVQWFAMSDGMSFNGAVEIIINDGTARTAIDSSFLSKTAAGGKWMLYSDGESGALSSAGTIGKYKVANGYVATAYYLVDGERNGTTVGSKNGVLDLSNAPGEYEIVYTEGFDGAIVYVDATNGSDIYDGLTPETAFASIAKAETQLNESVADGDKKIFIIGTVDFKPSVAHEDMFIYEAYDSNSVLNLKNTSYLSGDIYDVMELKGPTTFVDFYFDKEEPKIHTCGYTFINKTQSKRIAVHVGNIGQGDGIGNRELFVYEASTKDYYWHAAPAGVYVGSNTKSATTVNGADIYLNQGKLSHLYFSRNNTFTDTVNITFNGVAKRGDGYGGYVLVGENIVFEKALQVIFNNGQKSWLLDSDNISALESVEAEGGTWILYGEQASDGSVLETTAVDGKFKVKGSLIAKAVNIESGNTHFSVDGTLDLSEYAGKYDVSYISADADDFYDVTKDGSVDGLDFDAIRNVILKAIDILFYDVNRDGFSDSRDVVAMKKRLANS
ncbi:MAG: metallophosphoesterase [Faecalimonas sp.]|nr:metallophosphoesterase [Faecalimonas sp.]